MPITSADIRKRLKAPLYLAVSHHYRGDDRERINRLAELAQRNQTGLLATNDVLYHHSSRRVLQDVVTAIREGVTIARCGLPARGQCRAPPEDAR